MMLGAKLRSFLGSVFRRRQLEQEMSDELQFHLESRAADLMRRGLSAEAAYREARIEFGSREKYKDHIRQAKGLRLLDELRGDLRYGFQSLRRSPGFSAVAVLSLAFGIGANTLIFGLIHSTVLQSLGYPEPDRLAVIWTVTTDTKQTRTSSVSTYFALRNEARSFEAVGGFNGGACGVRSLGSDSDGTPAERLYGQCFSPTLFRVLGVAPMLGRTFTDAEDQAGNVAPVVLISHGLWQRRFGGDRSIIGKTIVLNQVVTTVIGVLPPDFQLFRDPNIPLASRSPEIDFVAPLELGPTQVNSRVGGITIVGRLKPQVSIERAQTEIETIIKNLAETNPERHGGLSVRAEWLLDVAHRDYRASLLILQGAVSLVLLIGCANVAGLLLARNASRRHEVALRMTLGASRWRILRQLVTESLPLALVGGVAGLFLSSIGTSLFVSLAPVGFPRTEEYLDLSVIGFTAVVVVVTSALCSILPAMQAARANLVDPLKESSRSAAGGVSRQRIRKVLVMGQVAFAVVLLIGAGLMINSFVRIVQSDLGADPSNLLTFGFHLPPADTIKPMGMFRGVGLAVVSPKPVLMIERLLDELKTIPGVKAVAAVNTPPFSGMAIPLPFFLPGQSPAAAELMTPPDLAQQTAQYLAATPGYFDLMKIPILKGRDFDSHDTDDGRQVVIVNETMARQFFSDVDPIGKQVIIDFVPNPVPREIIAVVGHTSTGPMERRPEPAMYVPHLQQGSQWPAAAWGPRSGMYLVLRTIDEPSRFVGAVQAAVGRVDRNIPAADIATADQILHRQTRNLRLYAVLLMIFAAIAALLAATGIYGVIAFSVAERTREIGIRIALGGGKRNVLGMVLRQASWMVAGGLAAGLVSALALTGLIQSMLFGIAPHDAATYVVISLLLLFIAALACLIPARRAAGIDPAMALKHDG